MVVQSNHFAETDSVLLCLLTTTTRDASFYRLPLSPAPKNGLEARSDIMVDKVMALPRVKCGGVIGSLELDEMARLDEALKLILALA